VCRHTTGLAVLDNLVIRCEQHVSIGDIATIDRDAHIPELVSVPIEPPPRVVLSSGEGEVLESFAGYALVRRIGSGGMAECFVGTGEESGEQVFVKRVRLESPDMAALQREAEIYQKLERRGCEHTPRVVDYLRTEAYQVLVTECAECDLEDYVREKGRIPTDEVKRIAIEIIDGLRELHEADIVHRDLKPRNILRSNGRWLLADFGIAKDRRGAGGGRTFRNSGTSGYAAPEQLLTGLDANPAADLYALGKVLVFLLTGGTDVDRVLFLQWRRLIKECTAELQDKRPSLTDVAAGIEGIDE
jgi:serine/threonine protein kinase